MLNLLGGLVAYTYQDKKTVSKFRRNDGSNVACRGVKK